jgi:RNase H-fold protein (predicted Holliday junction resolvase)
VTGVTTGPILGIDPGTRKCGIAVIAAQAAVPLALEIIPFERFQGRIEELVKAYDVRAIALGGGTHTVQVASMLAGLGLPVGVVNEQATTLLARARYFDANPPRGWRRFVPRGMLLPPRPIDDYAALLIAERFLESEQTNP